ncbi:hypothetical protein cyc_00449 [Cyclospora cayetanensis]|uniref:Uncharacterized protein n=1 Tax=Cyclospora cayetanensis TaxID=88456 RepID=A0A1D3D4S4_9EIME|nr:hypothetical protein cyc_00449 [Cyclospora cayetanensis]
MLLLLPVLKDEEGVAWRGGGKPATVASANTGSKNDTIIAGGTDSGWVLLLLYCAAAKSCSMPRKRGIRRGRVEEQTEGAARDLYPLLLLPLQRRSSNLVYACLP